MGKHHGEETEAIPHLRYHLPFSLAPHRTQSSNRKEQEGHCQVELVKGRDLPDKDLKFYHMKDTV